jgi:hypothetical protein
VKLYVFRIKKRLRYFYVYADGFIEAEARARKVTARDVVFVREGGK